MEGELEIKVISAKHLWAFNFFQKLCVYASVCVCSSGSKEEMQEQRTESDQEGDGHPEWNQTMSFRLSDLSSFSSFDLRFQIRHHAGLLFPDRTIGEVRVPLSELVQSSAFRFVDYQIKSPDDKPNGVLHFGYKIKSPHPHAEVESTYSISGYPQIDSPSTLYPPAPHLSQDTSPDDAQPYPPPLWPPPPPMPYWRPPGPPPPPPYYHYPWNYPPRSTQ